MKEDKELLESVVDGAVVGAPSSSSSSLLEGAAMNASSSFPEVKKKKKKKRKKKKKNNSDSSSMNARKLEGIHPSLHAFHSLIAMSRRQANDLEKQKNEKGRYSFYAEHTPSSGRRLVAARDIAEGETLFVERPFAWVTHADGLQQSCATCNCAHPLDEPKSASEDVFPQSRGRPYKEWFCKIGCEASNRNLRRLEDTFLSGTFIAQSSVYVYCF